MNRKHRKHFMCFILLLLPLLRLHAAEPCIPGYPSFCPGIGTTFDITIQGIDKKYTHGHFIYSPFRSLWCALSIRTFVLLHHKHFQIRLPVTVTAALLYLPFGRFFPFPGCGPGLDVNDSSLFLFLQGGIDYIPYRNLMFSAGSNLLFTGYNHLDFELVFSLLYCF